MRIGALARQTGVSERSLRYYEEQGLLSAQRTPGGHRDYADGAVDRVLHIQQLYAAGLCSSKIAELLPCLRDTDGGPAKNADGRLAATLAVERDRIDRSIDELRRSRALLDDVINTAVGTRAEPAPEDPSIAAKARASSGEA